MTKNIHYVINVAADIRPIFEVFEDAYKTGVLHEDFADLFSIEILKGYHPDGSDRMIINAA
jgi:hypothetical protein